MTKASLEIDFGREIIFNRFVAQENIAFGQRVKKFSIRVWRNDRYEAVAQQTTIGYKRILVFPVVNARKIQLMIRFVGVDRRGPGLIDTTLGARGVIETRGVNEVKSSSAWWYISRTAPTPRSRFGSESGETIRQGQFDLPGDERRIRSVEVWYGKGNWGRSRPQLVLYGRR
jgi:hypothetical protein